MKQFNVAGSVSGRVQPRIWDRRITIQAPNSTQVWRYVWERALWLITPDEKTITDPYDRSKFLRLWKQWSYVRNKTGKVVTDHSGDPMEAYILRPMFNSFGFERGRQAALGRALGYSGAAPHHGVFSGWCLGSKPRGVRADKLLSIAGFETYSHAMFTWAGAGGAPSPVKKSEPLPKLNNKGMVKLCEEAIERDLGMCVDGDSSSEEIHEEANVIVLDALSDAGCSRERAFLIATQVLEPYRNAAKDQEL